MRYSVDKAVGSTTAFASAVGDIVGETRSPVSALPELDFSEIHGLTGGAVPVEIGLVTTYADDGETTGDVGSDWVESPGLRVTVGARGNRECKRAQLLASHAAVGNKVTRG